MRKEKQQLVYVFGPPCSGKSSLCSELIDNLSMYKYIMGDDYWITNEQEDFKARSQKTDEDILSLVSTITSNLILLEWVPCYGSFVDTLKDICKVKNYEFIHIIVYAPKEILEKRKLKRDGNIDLGPLNIEKYETSKDVKIFDTSLIVSKCLDMLKGQL